MPLQWLPDTLPAGITVFLFELALAVPLAPADGAVLGGTA